MNLAHATDVPDFAEIGGDYLTFTGIENSKGHQNYYYDFDVYPNESFAEQFVRQLTSNYNFKLTGHVAKDYREDGVPVYSEVWFLNYTGSKRVGVFNDRAPGGCRFPCSLSIFKNKDWGENHAYFCIGVADGLDYGNKFKGIG